MSSVMTKHPSSDASDATASHIVVSGASGLVGSRLVPHLRSRGHRVSTLVRNQAAGDGEIAWDPDTGKIDASTLAGVTGVIHLSGVSIAGGRWTASRKETILKSRVQSTDLLARTIAGLDQPPAVMISTSAVGYYGDAGDRQLDESAPAGEGFLAEVCKSWEAAANPARAAGIRVVHPRLGVVLAREGGVLNLIAKVFRLGIGGNLGNGRQYFPWIAIDDLVSVLERAITDPTLEGPVNAVAPQQTTNAEFTRAMCAALHRPTIMAAPAFMIKAVGGELAEELLLASQRVVPARLEAAGFTFALPTIDVALGHELAPGAGSTS